VRAGAERFRTIVTSYVRGAHIILACCESRGLAARCAAWMHVFISVLLLPRADDVTDEKSFQSVQGSIATVRST
jgi:hypothetical protein